MPHSRDFSTLTGLGSLEVEVPGWKGKLTIEYGYEEISRVSYLNWRVSGTTHTFKVSYYSIMAETGGNYETHFQWFLENFRKEYLEWIYAGLTEPWMQEYYEQYKHIIEF